MSPGGNPLRVPLLHLRIGVMNEMQYRANFFIQLLESVVLTGTGLVALSLIFDHTNDLDGWTRPQLLIVLGVYTVVGGLIQFVIQPNMARIMSEIRLGTFDYVLTKPVDSQLLATLREFHLWRLTDVAIGIAVTAWGVVSLDEPVSAGDIAAFAFVIAVGMVLVYCIWLVVTAGAFWFVKMDEVHDLFTGMYRAGQYPVTAYPTWLRLILTYLVPIGFAVTVPSESLTGRLTGERIAVTIGFLLVAVTVTRLVWRAGTRRYSGASA
jgi:ABC-2 type transport system permease protein